jgi:hypothetical protein
VGRPHKTRGETIDRRGGAIILFPRERSSAVRRTRLHGDDRCGVCVPDEAHGRRRRWLQLLCCAVAIPPAAAGLELGQAAGVFGLAEIPGLVTVMAGSMVLAGLALGGTRLGWGLHEVLARWSIALLVGAFLASFFAMRFAALAVALALAVLSVELVGIALRASAAADGMPADRTTRDDRRGVSSR